MADFEAEAVERVTRVKREVTDRLLALPGVNIVSVGGKETGGRDTGELVIQVWVDKKLPLEEIPPEQRIPAEIDGVRTDVYEGGQWVPLAAEGLAVREATGVLVLDEKTDGKTYRPVIGGARIAAENASPKPDTKYGTMACVLHDPIDVEIAYGLTCRHVIQRFLEEPNPVPGVTRVGQPTNDASSSCCNDIVGTYVAGHAAVVPHRDEALFALAPGTKFVFDIAEIGYITGIREVSPNEAHEKVKVRKRGARTGLTGGEIFSVSSTGSGLLDEYIIRPFDLPGQKRDDVVYFVDHGDSGSAVVDFSVADSCKVIGLIRAREATREEKRAKKKPVPDLPPDGVERVWAYALPIAAIIKRFQDTDNIRVQVPIATERGQVHTASGGSTVAVPDEIARLIEADPLSQAAFTGEVGNDGGLRAQVGRPWFAGRPPEAVVAGLRERAEATPAGRLLIAFWREHREELTRLVRTDRRAKVVWHRGGGAAIAQLAMRMVSRPELALPETVDGRPLLDCVDELVAVLAGCGSAQLRGDLASARRVLPDIGGRTLGEIVYALGAESTKQPATTTAAGGDA